MDSLQFQKVEYAGDVPVCASCRALLEREYYQFAGHDICGDCAQKVREARQPPSNPAVLRGLLYGAGAALACSIGYAAIILITNLELALVAIAVGWIVGKAIRRGTNGRGGRRVQVLAVALTYLSITFSYVPVAVRQMTQQTEAASKQEKSEEPAPAPQEISGATWAVAVVIMAGYALISPLMNLTDGVGGILGIIIIGVGLMQAWRLTAGDTRPLTGPFQREGAVFG